MGARALFTQAYSNTDTAWDSHNTAVGYEALYANQPTATNNGVYNTAIGSGAMRSNTTGVRNTAMGYQSLYYNETGYYNTAIGYAALYSNTTGHENTALGLWAGDSWQTGYYNTFVGNSADAGVEGLFNATAIGYGAIVTASNMVRLGNDAVTLIQGAVNFTTPSDIRLKKDVEDIGQGLDFGFIAQDIEALIGTDYNVLGIGADADRTLSLRYTDFIAPMVKAIQEQQGIIEQLKAEVAELKRMLGK